MPDRCVNRHHHIEARQQRHRIVVVVTNLRTDSSTSGHSRSAVSMEPCRCAKIAGSTSGIK